MGGWVNFNDINIKSKINMMISKRTVNNLSQFKEKFTIEKEENNKKNGEKKKSLSNLCLNIQYYFLSRKSKESKSFRFYLKDDKHAQPGAD